jgi:hypothetical protein
VAVEDLRATYRDAVLAWDAAASEPRRANKLFDRRHELSKEMRQTEDGRAAIEGLLDDPVVAVRLCAATDTLMWSPERAEPVLEALQDDLSLHAVTAKWTLRSYRAGRLDLDW